MVEAGGEGDKGNGTPTTSQVKYILNERGREKVREITLRDLCDLFI